MAQTTPKPETKALPKTRVAKQKRLLEISKRLGTEELCKPFRLTGLRTSDLKVKQLKEGIKLMESADSGVKTMTLSRLETLRDAFNEVSKSAKNSKRLEEFKKENDDRSKAYIAGISKIITNAADIPKMKKVINTLRLKENKKRGEETLISKEALANLLQEIEKIASCVSPQWLTGENENIPAYTPTPALKQIYARNNIIAGNNRILTVGHIKEMQALVIEAYKILDQIPNTEYFKNLMLKPTELKIEVSRKGTSKKTENTALPKDKPRAKRKPTAEKAQTTPAPN